MTDKDNKKKDIPKDPWDGDPDLRVPVALDRSDKKTNGVIKLSDTKQDEE